MHFHYKDEMVVGPCSNFSDGLAKILMKLGYG